MNLVITSQEREIQHKVLITKLETRLMHAIVSDDSKQHKRTNRERIVRFRVERKPEEKRERERESVCACVKRL